MTAATASTLNEEAGAFQEVLADVESNDIYSATRSRAHDVF
jgi:hypothetical protein